MTHDEFMTLYDTSLRHAWATSKDADKYAEQKRREKEYNAKYYQEHKEKWDESGTGSYYDEKTGRRFYNFQDERDRQENASAMARNAIAELAEERKRMVTKALDEANKEKIASDTLRGVSSRQMRQRIYDRNAASSKGQTSAIQARNAASASKRAQQANLKTVQNFMTKAAANTTPLTKIKQVARIAIQKGKSFINKLASYLS